MKILHVLDHSLPLHSGYVFRTAAILREQRARGWETLQMTTPRQGRCEHDDESVDGLRFYRTRLPQRRWRRPAGLREWDEMRATAARLEALVREHSPDIVHAHSPVLNALPALWVARRHKLPMVYEVRALWEDAAVDHGTTTPHSMHYRVARALETFAVQRADRVTTICEGLRRDLLQRGIPDAKISVVPNAVDIAAFPPGNEADTGLRERLGLQHATVLGFAGSFFGYEGLDLLLEALALLVQRFPALKLLLVGGGPQEGTLRARAIELGLADRVVFAGRVPHAQMHMYYDLINVLVYPRRSMRLTELVTPLKPLEAMAQGRIVVASDVGGHRELIRDRDTGLLFPAGDASALAATLCQALLARRDWEAMHGRARRFVEQERTWPRCVARYADVYSALLEGRLRTAAVT
jgi:PEP-CTERM/exosortase A-associated glycosyltransferase